jgi:hypothetical protein
MSARAEKLDTKHSLDWRVGEAEDWLKAQHYYPSRPATQSFVAVSMVDWYGTPEVAPISFAPAFETASAGGASPSCTCHAAIFCAGIAIGSPMQASTNNHGSEHSGALTSCGNTSASPG